MRAYSVSVNLKLWLIVGAVAIAVSSLVYTNRLAERLREQERRAIRTWAGALEQLSKEQTSNPYLAELDSLEGLLARGALRPAGIPAESLRSAIAWARQMPPSGHLTFLFDVIVEPGPSLVPAIITDAKNPAHVEAQNVRVDPALSPEARRAYLRRLAAEMDEVHEPIRIRGQGLEQLVHYGESPLVRHLRIFPYVQLLFVTLFILVGYLGFSYVRRSEQSNLWVGMAKEAAHQLGTPISSMMGWIELLKTRALAPEQEAEVADELAKDVARLQRVTSRFSDIGSLPKLEPQPLAPVVHATADYIRRRMPQRGRRVRLEVEVPGEIVLPLNAELFEWVIENLLKNALDAMEREEGLIEIRAFPEGARVRIDVRDTGKGIDRRNWKNVFRPGFSTKQRGWGLGLSLAKRIVEDYHGGVLQLASSRPGQGSTFRIWLPTAGRAARQTARRVRFRLYD